MAEPEFKVELPKIEESVEVSETENSVEPVEVIEDKPKRKINKVETVD